MKRLLKIMLLALILSLAAWLIATAAGYVAAISLFTISLLPTK